MEKKRRKEGQCICYVKIVLNLDQILFIYYDQTLSTYFEESLPRKYIQILLCSDQILLFNIKFYLFLRKIIILNEKKSLIDRVNSTFYQKNHEFKINKIKYLNKFQIKDLNIKNLIFILDQILIISVSFQIKVSQIRFHTLLNSLVLLIQFTESK